MDYAERVLLMMVWTLPMSKPVHFLLLDPFHAFGAY